MTFGEFLEKYLGMIIGILIAILIIIIDLNFNIVRVIEYIAIIGFCAWFGKYVQNNKENVKLKLKSFIDKM